MMEPTALNTEADSNPEGLILELYYHDAPIVVLPEQTPFLLGRDSGKPGLSVRCEFASRLHCAIEFQGGKFVLKDFSRNGTFVQLNRAQAFRVQNEVIPLIGSGSFKLGAAIGSEDPERILFKVKTVSRKATN